MHLTMHLALALALWLVPAAAFGTTATSEQVETDVGRRELRRTPTAHAVLSENPLSDEAVTDMVTDADLERMADQDPLSDEAATDADLERMSDQTESDYIQAHGYPLRLSIGALGEGAQRPDAHVPRNRVAGLPAIVVQEYPLRQSSGEHIILEYDLDGRPVRANIKMGKHQTMAFYQEYYDDAGDVWQAEQGFSNLAWGKNPTSMLTDNPLIGAADKAHVWKITGDYHNTKGRNEVLMSLKHKSDQWKQDAQTPAVREKRDFAVVTAMKSFDIGSQLVKAS